MFCERVSDFGLVGSSKIHSSNGSSYARDGGGGIGFRGKSRRRRMGGHFLDDRGRGHLAHRWEHSHMTSIVGGRGTKL